MKFLTEKEENKFILTALENLTILEAGGRKLEEETKIDPNSPEYVEQLSRIFAAIQTPLESERNHETLFRKEQRQISQQISESFCQEEPVVASTSYTKYHAGESKRVIKINKKTKIKGFQHLIHFGSITTSAGGNKGIGGAIASGGVDYSTLRIGDDNSEMKFLSASVGGELGAGLGGIVAGYSLSADVASVRAGGFQANVGYDGGSGLTIGPGGVEAKVAGLGISIGKKMGISTPIGGISIDLGEACVVQKTDLKILKIEKRQEKGSNKNIIMNDINQQRGNYYIIADHLRTAIFALADGAVFEPKGRGYILKKLVKKATLLAYLINLNSEQLQKISEKLIEVNSPYYRHLKEKEGLIIRELKKEIDKSTKFISKSNRELDKYYKPEITSKNIFF
nr:6553_t:CDS:2 [Entrophospora candida]